MVQWGNNSFDLIKELEEELPGSSVYWMLISIVAAIAWVLYICYYNSHVVGYFLTLFVNRFVKKAHVKFGSFSISVLSGKIMFRDVHYITEDYSIRIQLGFVIFRWWRPLISKEFNEDLSHSETRLSVYLDMFECHVYNRSMLYSDLEKMFGLDQLVLSKKFTREDSRESGTGENGTNKATPTQKSKWQWRDLIPVIKLHVLSGKFVFGNYLTPTTMTVNFVDANIVYTTKTASTPFDQFMHIIKCNADQMRVRLTPSPKYTGPADEPPRFMGDGFVVLQSSDVDIYYYFDEPDLVPYEPEMVALANGDVISRRTWPCWGMDVKCGKGTDISYGPWADRQRESLWKMFYPASYQNAEVDKVPEPGQMRQFKTFDFKLSMQNELTIDLLFTKHKETQAIHMNAKAGSYLEFCIPQMTSEDGYRSKINGQLMHVDATTSLKFRSLLECETVEFDVEAHYPRNYNDHQDWKLNLTVCKSSVFFVYQHKIFFTDLIDDWSAKVPPDIFHFIPYTWHLNFIMKEFEIIVLANSYNWVDCSGQSPENNQLAVCGDMFDMSFALPFNDYLPPTVPIKFFIRGESAAVRLFLPDTNTSRYILQALMDNLKVMSHDGTVLKMPYTSDREEKQWRRNTHKNAGWIDIWTSPIVALSISYVYHPSPIMGGLADSAAGSCSGQTSLDVDHLPVSTPEAEEQLLIPLRYGSASQSQRHKVTASQIDPLSMDPDEITLELEVGPSVLCVYSSLIINFLSIKENYLGEDQKFTDFSEILNLAAPTDLNSAHQTKSVPDIHVEGAGQEKLYDPRQYRPLSVKVQVTLYDIQAHLVKHCDESSSPCPSVFIERLGFELDKQYEETKLQVLTSSAVLLARDNLQRPEQHQHLSEGHLALSGLQIRGHAMFSHEGLPIDSDTLEYGWLLELTIGDVTGRITAPQLQNVLEFLQTFVFLVDDAENDLQRVHADHICQHGIPEPQCLAGQSKSVTSTENTSDACNKENTIGCPSPEDIKYRMTRVSLDSIDIYLAEQGAALNLQIYPIRLATCNLHGKNNKAGLSVLIPHINIKQYIHSTPVTQEPNKNDCWLEAGGISLGPINVDAAMALPDPEYHNVQDTFLKTHDLATRRLWFLWPPDMSGISPKTFSMCGCVGGCTFFGSNRNGARFFQPSSPADFKESVNTAVFHMCNTKGDFGFGQSLIRKNQLIFDGDGGCETPVPSIKSYTRNSDQGSMKGSRRSLDTTTTKTSGTLVDTGSMIRASMLSSFSDVGSEQLGSDGTLKGSSTIPSSLPTMSEHESETLSSHSRHTVPAEFMPDDAIPDAYDTDKDSVSNTSNWIPETPDGSMMSLPETVKKRPKVSHIRNSSADTPSTFPRRQDSSDRTVSNDSFSLQGSKGSLPSSYGTYSDPRSLHSSLTSPVLRRLSSQYSMANDGSGTGSEFYSAAEDMSDPNISITSDNETQQALKAWTSRMSTDSDLSSITINEEANLSLSLSSTPVGGFDKTVVYRRERSTASTDTESNVSFVSAVSSQNTPTRESQGNLYDNTLDSLLTDSDTTEDLDEMDTDMTEVPQPAPTFVDLHGQTNQPITKSRLLMSCYQQHMTQLGCKRWNHPPTLQQLLKSHMTLTRKVYRHNSRQSTGTNSLGPPVTAQAPGAAFTHAWIPHFIYIQQGFSPSLMTPKPQIAPPSSTSSNAEWDKLAVFEDFDELEPPGIELSCDERHISKTTAAINLKGPINVMISPLLLESSQRFIEAVTPTLSALHPSAILDTLHFECVQTVKASNRLKKQESKHQSAEDATTTVAPAKTKASKRTSNLSVPVSDHHDTLSKTPSTVNSTLNTSVNTTNTCAKSSNRDSTISSGNPGAKPSNRDSSTEPGSPHSARKMTNNGSSSNNLCQPEIVTPKNQPGCKTSRLQIMLNVAKVNISILQTSLVEQTISMAALEHIRELTCVSVLAVCLDDMSCELLVNDHSLKTIDASSSDASPDSVVQKPLTSPGSKKGRQEGTIVEHEADKFIELQREEIVGRFHISKIHLQLRRMKRANNMNDKVFLTAIPEHRSKVMFTFQQMGQDSLPRNRKSSSPQSSTSEHLSAEDIAGFIMFECGLEDITVSASKRKGFENSWPVDDTNRLIGRSNMSLHDLSETGAVYDHQSQHTVQSSQRDSQRDSILAAHSRHSSVGSSEGSTTAISGNSADDEASSWHSRISEPAFSSSQAEDLDTPTPPTPDLQGDATSCVIDFKAVWFNFAAPPLTHVKKKLEFTKMDWNLLSTATPAINAWMKPSHRAIVAGQTLLNDLQFRVCAVVACVMTEALDVDRLHRVSKSKYKKLTSLSHMLQEDPSCQLITVLRRYLRHVGVNSIDANITVDTVPQILTIKRGLLALTRQWKTVLHMPVLADSSFKNKKKVQPYTVTFAIPKDDSIDNFQFPGEDADSNVENNYEIIDEKTSLLRAEGGSTHGGSTSSFLDAVTTQSQGLGGVDGQLSKQLSASATQLGAENIDKLQTVGKGVSSDSVLQQTADRKLGGTQSRNKLGVSTPFSSVDSPDHFKTASQRSQSVAPGGSTGLLHSQHIGKAALLRRNDSSASVISGVSISASSGEHRATPAPSTPLKQSFARQLSMLDKREDEDLYRWMQRQQEYTKLCNHPGLHYYPSMGADSLLYTGGTAMSDYSQDDNLSVQRMSMAPSFWHQADALVLFRPLLKSIGIHHGAIKPTTLLKRFGGDISIQGKLHTLRVDIVDSEVRKEKGSKTHRQKGKRTGWVHVDTLICPPPAFICENFSVAIGLKNIIDFDKSRGEGMSDLRPNSLRLLRLSMNQLDTKPVTTNINFSLNVDSITQHVNMSLLRLVHQFVTMIQNIHETRLELEGVKDDMSYKTHKKQDSSSGTESQIDERDKVPKRTAMPDLDTPRADISSVDHSESAEPFHRQASDDYDRLDDLNVPKSPKKLSIKRPKLELVGGNKVATSDDPTNSTVLPSVTVQSPQSLNWSDSAVVEIPDTSSPAVAEKTIIDEIKDNTPKCWRTLYHLLDLYSTMPETKTVMKKTAASRLSVIDEEPEKGSQTHSIHRVESQISALDAMEAGNTYNTLSPKQKQPGVDGSESIPLITKSTSFVPATRTYPGNMFMQSIVIGERTPLVLFGIAHVKRVHMSATLSGLKLEAELQNAHASATHKEMIKGAKRKTSESSATAQVGHTMIVLREGAQNVMQTVVTINIASSRGIYSSTMKRSRSHNSSLFTVGCIDVDIPQHPVILHGMISRGSKQFSSSIQEFMRAPASKAKSVDSVDAGTGMPNQHASKHSDLSHEAQQRNSNTTAAVSPDQAAESRTKSLVVHFKAVLRGLTIAASLLPSLKAQYKIGEVTTSGVSGRKARFVVELPIHSLSFSSKVVSIPSSLPSSAIVELPPIHVHADYRQHVSESEVTHTTSAPGQPPDTEAELTEGLVFREGSYLNAVAEVGSFEHSLTTDLLNHLVFVQKVFMKEVNEVVQKVSGADQPVPLWTDEGFSMASPRETPKPPLYSLLFRLKGIQITATTPTSIAVRLETGSIELELSNRVQNANIITKNPKVFVKAQVDLNLGLGTLQRNPMFEEADPEFQQLASFQTRIGLRNGLEDEMIPGVSKDQEALLISLKRPIICVQPAAFDKAVLVWLNYKNAYEYWNEQRLALNKEVQTATQQVFEAPIRAFTAAATNLKEGLNPGPSNLTNSSAGQEAPALGTLFLQLTVEDLGICLPMDSYTQGFGGTKMIEERGAALVLTLTSTQISACSCGSLVSKGKFTDFCLRFADDFEVTWDDWKPMINGDTPYVMNAMVVPEGTYEVCSRTITANTTDPLSNPKWILNVVWNMRGIDVHLDHNIGKRLSALGNALTALTGDFEISNEMDEDSNGDEVDASSSKTDAMNRKSSVMYDDLPDFIYDTSLDLKTRARLIEKEMNEQAKVVEDLKQLGATQATVDAEEKKLHDLEHAVSNKVRQDIFRKLKKQSVKATTLKDKLGIGYKPTHTRSRSTGTSALLAEQRREKFAADARRLTSMTEELSDLHTPDELEQTTVVRRAGHHRNYSIDVSDMSVPEVYNVNRPLSHPDMYNGKSSQLPQFSLDDISSSSEDESEVTAPKIDKHLKPSSLLRSSGPPSPGVSSQSGISKTGQSAQTVDINVDFELDVMVNIDSGQCVLHPKESKAEQDAEGRKSSKRDHSPTSSKKKHRRNPKQAAPIAVENTTLFNLPGVDVKVHYSSTNSPGSTDSPTGSSKADPATPHTPNAPNIPHVHHYHHTPYTSHTMPDLLETPNVSMSAPRKPAIKRANLYAWVSLQKLSEEMLITPVLLQFLEQALEPIPMPPLTHIKTPTNESPSDSSSTSPTEPSSSNDLDMSNSSLTSTNYVYASFPVDVVVYIRVQPSMVRLSCLPLSRVECLLRLPSLDLVFSTKRADVEGNMISENPPNTKSKGFPKKTPSSSNIFTPRAGSSIPGYTTPDGRQRMGSANDNIQGSTAMFGGGLSVTGCLADFSLYIFHPYGGGQKKQTLSNLESSFYRKDLDSSDTLEIDPENLSSPLTDTGRKDSLSLNVEFVKVNISRSRKGIFQGETSTTQSSAKLSTLPDGQTKAANIVRFSAVCDIGSASFKYDMRRLSEILMFPKAWYSRNLARRVFLGEEKSADYFNESSESENLTDTLNSSGSTTAPNGNGVLSNFGRACTTSAIHESHLDGVLSQHHPGISSNQHRRVASADKNVPISLEFKQELDYINKGPAASPPASAPQSPNNQQTPTASKPPKSRPRKHSTGAALLQSTLLAGDPLSGSQFTSQIRPGPTAQKWETLVLFSVNLSRLDVMINMGNVMGNTGWTTSELQSEGRLSIDSSGHKHMNIEAGLGSSKLESRGGVVGGSITLNKLVNTLIVSEDPGHEPDHRAKFQLHTLEARLDYMGSSVLMLRLSEAGMSLSDEWRLNFTQLTQGQPLATKRPVQVFVHGDLSWDKFHMMISRSTTPDLIKMVAKVEEFFSQQLKSSRRMLLHIRQTNTQKPLTRKNSDASWISEIRHHRHWQQVFDHAFGCQLPMLSMMRLPQHGIILGGSAALHGNDLSLACFHGINFRSKSWALFTMTEPYICFSTEAQDIVGECAQQSTHIVQTLSFQLGHNAAATTKDKPMATICKLSRGHYMPPPFTSVQDWFHYAFATTDLKVAGALFSRKPDLDTFPQSPQPPLSEGERRPKKTQEYSHDTEIIFALPSLQMHLKTEHLQGEQEPSEHDPKSVVECSFVTEFDDHIFVAMDAEAILFLHDLVTHYVKEKDRAHSRVSTYKVARSPEAEKTTPSDPTSVLKQDFRQFDCKTWHLEPTVRLILWASKRIDPVGVDYILQKLGFQHARLTIPKWMQRGAMDPLDKVLSLLVYRLITVLKVSQTTNGENGTENGR